MKKSIIVILLSVLFFMFVGNVKAQEVYNGYKWIELDEVGKIYWLRGFMEGFYQTSKETDIFFIWFVKGYEIITSAKVDNTLAISSEFTSIFRKKTTPCAEDMTVGQMTQGLDEFYENYRNKSVPVSEAMYIIKLEVMGAPRKFIEEQIRIIRMLPDERCKEHTFLFESDKEYKENTEKWCQYLPFCIFPLASIFPADQINKFFGAQRRENNSK